MLLCRLPDLGYPGERSRGPRHSNTHLNFEDAPPGYFYQKGLKKLGGRVGESHRGSARPFSSSEVPHVLQGTCATEKRQQCVSFN